jgi:hypothetical protein
LQVLGDLNCRFDFGPATKPPGGCLWMMAEPLVKVYAIKDIDPDTELLCSYGDKFWVAK